MGSDRKSTSGCQARSSVAERCQHMAEEGVRFLPRLPCECASRWPRIPTWRRSRFLGATVGDEAVVTLEWRLLAVLAMLAVMAGCGGSRQVETPAEYDAWLKSQNPGKPEQPQGASEYVIGAGDSLSVFVWKNNDLSEAGVGVRPDGRISVPLIDEIVAAGKTPPELAHDIEERLKKYVQDPLVTVIVRSFVGPANRQIRVIGEATDPQAISYREDMTVLDVMIATKGLTKYASGNRAIIVRRGPDGKEHNISVRLDDLIKSGDISQNVAMQPGDTLIIPQSWF
jgi:polysaccharide biosynthesis/export protein